MTGEGSSELREEFRGRKFGLGHQHPHLFVIPQCVPALFYIAWVSFWALFYLVTLSFEIYYGDSTDSGAEYFIFLTNWSYLLQSTLVFTDFTVTFYIHFKRKDILNGETDCTPWYVKLLWVLFNINNVTAIMVTLLYYALLTPMFNHSSINTHMLNSVYTLSTFIFCAKPVNLLHFYQPMIYAAIYCIFSVAWQQTGNDPVYDILDWNDVAGTIRLTAIILLIAIPLLHIIVFSMHTFKRWLSEKLNCTGSTQSPDEKKLEKEVTSGEIELNHSFQKINSVHPI